MITVARGFLVWFVAVLTAVIVVGACKSDPTPTVLQALDLAVADGSPDNAQFMQNTILDTNAFTDYQTLDRDAIQKLLAKTPYSRASFLETYQSNGVRAADAIVAAAVKHRINPLVFVVLAETTQGLVGAREYVFPPERVEYIFNCGCLQKTNCLPDLAGFDRQVDCLGSQLRDALDQIAANDHTAGGWAPDGTSTTVDGIKVSPSNEATAVLYDHNPRVNLHGPGGIWVFWNVWNLYAKQADYFGPLGAVDGKGIGDPCTSNLECGAIDGAMCATGDDYPDGMCVYDCTVTKACPSRSGSAPSFCGQFSEGAFCLPTCNPEAPAGTGCRTGYGCVKVKGVNQDSSGVCFKAKTQ